MISDYRIVWSVARLTLFYWIIFTVISLAANPLGIREGISLWFDQTKYTLMLMLVFSCLAALVVLLRIHLTKNKVLRHMKSSERLGIISSKGPVPAKDFLKIDPQAVMKPVHGQLLQHWVETQDKIAKETGKDSVYVNLFHAVWRIYSQYAHFPASHRLGGHGDRRLYLHCHDVAEHCLRLVQSGWQYEGIFVKKRGRKPVKIHSPNSSKSQLSPNDPLIPLVGLAHDIGKLLCYQVDEQGKIIRNLEGNSTTQDDDSSGVMHDYLGPRILAQLPEFWALNARDRNALTLAMAFYHHPSAVPLKANNMILDERAAMLMSLLIHADRQVSATESGIDVSDEVEEDNAEEIYSTFASIISTFGRINGTGSPSVDKRNMIGLKYADCIVMRERPLRLLLLKQLNLTEDGGEKRYHFTIKLLSILKEKGLLYTQHGTVDFGDYLPMYRVALYNPKRKVHMTTFAPALVIKIPDATMPEFESLGFLDLHSSIPVFESIMTTHLTKIKDPERLEKMNLEAFGNEAAQASRLEIELSDDELPDEVDRPLANEEKPIESPKNALSAEEQKKGAQAIPDETPQSAPSTQEVKKKIVPPPKATAAEKSMEEVNEMLSQIEALEANVQDIREDEDYEPSPELLEEVFGIGKPEGQAIVKEKPKKAKRKAKRRQDFTPVPELDSEEENPDFKILEQKTIPKPKKDRPQETQHREQIAKQIFKLGND